MATSKAGIVVITGRERGTSGGWNVLTMAWSKCGDRLWVKRLISRRRLADSDGRDVLVTAAGAMYITGRLVSDKAEDLFVAKYSKAGSLLWKKYIAGSAGFGD